MTLRPPARRPCPSCPYRRDVPSGVWDESEYEKLPEYDLETGEQPFGVFLCHQQDGRVCAGWAAVHDMDECLAIRLAAGAGLLDEETFLAVRDYETDVPLWETGQEAAAHGLREFLAPGEDARSMVDRLAAKKPRRSRLPVVAFRSSIRRREARS